LAFVKVACKRQSLLLALCGDQQMVNDQSHNFPKWKDAKTNLAKEKKSVVGWESFGLNLQKKYGKKKSKVQKLDF